MPSSLTANLISFWQFEEASGTRVDSVVSTGNNLTDNNTVTQAAGKVGFSAQFTTANSESLSRASNASLQTGDIDFTFAGWVWFDAVTTGLRQVVISKGNFGSVEYLLYLDTGDDIIFELGDGTGFINTAGTFTAGVWIFFVAWQNAAANTLNIKINNGTTDSASFSGGAPTNTDVFKIGADIGRFLGGRVDQLGFWKRVLTASEMTQLYNGGNGLSYAQVVGASTPTLSLLGVGSS